MTGIRSRHLRPATALYKLLLDSGRRGSGSSTRTPEHVIPSCVEEDPHDPLNHLKAQVIEAFKAMLHTPLSQLETTKLFQTLAQNQKTLDDLKGIRTALQKTHPSITEEEVINHYYKQYYNRGNQEKMIHQKFNSFIADIKDYTPLVQSLMDTHLEIATVVEQTIKKNTIPETIKEDLQPISQFIVEYAQGCKQALDSVAKGGLLPAIQLFEEPENKYLRGYQTKFQERESEQSDQSLLASPQETGLKYLFGSRPSTPTKNRGTSISPTLERSSSPFRGLFGSRSSTPVQSQPNGMSRQDMKDDALGILKVTAEQMEEITDKSLSFLPRKSPQEPECLRKLGSLRALIKVYS